MPQGRVKWYSAELGYGFILPYDGGTELLVRHEDVSDGGFGSLEKSVEVTYEAVEGREGPEAKNIQRSESVRIMGVSPCLLYNPATE